MSYHHCKVGLAGISLKKIVGKALCGHAHNVFVHAVGTCAHNSAQTACTKFKVLVESVDKVGLVLFVEHFLYLPACFLVESRR